MTCLTGEGSVSVHVSGGGRDEASPLATAIEGCLKLLNKAPGLSELVLHTLDTGIQYVNCNSTVLRLFLVN